MVPLPCPTSLACRCGACQRRAVPQPAPPCLREQRPQHPQGQTRTSRLQTSERHPGGRQVARGIRPAAKAGGRPRHHWACRRCRPHRRQVRPGRRAPCGTHPRCPARPQAHPQATAAVRQRARCRKRCSCGSLRAHVRGQAREGPPRQRDAEPHWPGQRHGARRVAPARRPGLWPQARASQATGARTPRCAAHLARAARGDRGAGGRREGRRRFRTYGRSPKRVWLPARGQRE